LKNKLNHIALILDGNKRWAQKNNLRNIYGYTKGFENIKKIVKYSLSLKISNLTLFTLSSENYNRSSVNLIYKIIYENFNNVFEELVRKNGVKVNIFGDRKNLPTKIIDIFDKIENLSSNNKSMNLHIAFNYGFKNEMKDVLEKGKK
jgi:Undecaprenyl pyrophosphate synthase